MKKPSLQLKQTMMLSPEQWLHPEEHSTHAPAELSPWPWEQAEQPELEHSSQLEGQPKQSDPEA